MSDLKEQSVNVEVMADFKSCFFISLVNKLCRSITDFLLKATNKRRQTSQPGAASPSGNDLVLSLFRRHISPDT